MCIKVSHLIVKSAQGLLGCFFYLHRWFLMIYVKKKKKIKNLQKHTYKRRQHNSGLPDHSSCDTRGLMRMYCLNHFLRYVTCQSCVINHIYHKKHPATKKMPHVLSFFLLQAVMAHKTSGLIYILIKEECFPLFKVLSFTDVHLLLA